jgi:hypothetical protein
VALDAIAAGVVVGALVFLHVPIRRVEHRVVVALFAARPAIGFALAISLALAGLGRRRFRQPGREPRYSTGSRGGSNHRY